MDRDDLTRLRRWVLVAAVWAVAATVVGLLALTDTSGSKAQQDADDVAGRVARVEKVERQLDKRLADLQGKLEGLPRSEDLTRLEQRLSRSEAASAKAAKASEDSGGGAGKVSELEDRVQVLEDAVEAAANGGGDGNPGRP